MSKIDTPIVAMVTWQRHSLYNLVRYQVLVNIYLILSLISLAKLGQGIGLVVLIKS